MPKLYNYKSPKSIETHGKKLVGGTLRTVIGEHRIPENELNSLVSGRTRGSLGNVVEQYYFGIHPGGDNSPDFKEAGVELKTTPIKKNKNGEYSAKERLVLGMINYIEEAEKDFMNSTYFKKNKKLMILSYLHDETKSIGDVSFLLAKLHEFEKLPREDQKIIREDWEKINSKIKAGLAHELSEGDTLYLGACTKSATGDTRREQIGGVPAKPRAFSYKSSYMTRLLKRELGVSEDVERLLGQEELEEGRTFEQQVIERFSSFIGKSTNEIASELDLKLNPKQKDKFATLARAMMGVKKGKIEEFEAAGVTMKTIQLRADGKPKEHMSFPNFKYTDIIHQKWDGDEEEGEVRAEFQEQLERRFLLIIYQCTDKCNKNENRLFKGAFFWTMPVDDLEEVRKVWEKTVSLIRTGNIVKKVEFNKKHGKRRYTFFPGSESGVVAHVRPHAKNSDDTLPLPIPDKFTNDIEYTKHCFWLNLDYIKKIINKNEI